MPFFPDCYDQWSLCIYDGRAITTLMEGTEEECREWAYSEWSDKEREPLFLMDWEGREWGL
jgi:hypothetical protein